ncbi:unnamed protein product [Spirodela intermedia]|uniref:Uncharacterized protein n=1 Tax=Spirodela intermedia TaxID=51605 RepID=A0A7I8LEH8_SPIIN|nr:unnamed protein product [Spirodela intermedia]
MKDVDDDDREFLEAAQEDAALVANLLMCLSRRENGGASGTSGSVCEDGWGVQPRPQKRQMERSLHEQGESSEPPDSAPGRPKAEFQNGAEDVQPSSPSKRPKPERSDTGGENRAPASTWMKTEAANVDGALRVFIPLEPSAVRSSPVAGSNKVSIPRLMHKILPRVDRRTWAGVGGIG